jgi:hypothetical protein
MSDTLRLLLALLDIAPEMERLLGVEWSRLRDELLVLAGRLDQEDDAAAIGGDLDALLKRLAVGRHADVVFSLPLAQAQVSFSSWSRRDANPRLPGILWHFRVHLRNLAPPLGNHPLNQG